jgi:hypothetical protein
MADRPLAVEIDTPSNQASSAGGAGFRVGPEQAG